MSKLCCFIVPYFGKLPATMPYFLKTCELNVDYNWIIFTNDRTDYPYPLNVQVNYCSFADIVALINDKIGYRVELKNPQKLCDMKPAYGYIFEEYLKDFDYWGYCDLDEYFGDLNHFISLEQLTGFEKIYSLGHMTIFKNNARMRNLFRIGNDFKQVASVASNQLFDEWPRNGVSINYIAEREKIKTYHGKEMFDVKPFKSYFSNVVFDEQIKKWKLEGEKNSVIVWRNGRIYSYYIECGQLRCREHIYVHIQKRKLMVKNDQSVVSNFIIIPNQIICLSEINNRQIYKALFLSWYKRILHLDEISHFIRAQGLFWSNKLCKFVKKE